MTLRAEFFSDFPDGNQAPIVQDGKWVLGAREGISWNDCKIVAGSPNKLVASAFVGGSGADDCLAARNDEYTPNCYIEGTVYRLAGYTPGDTHEIQLHHCLHYEPNNPAGPWARTYEWNYDQTSEGYQMAKWDGTLGNGINVMSDLGPTTGFSLVTDDKVRLTKYTTPDALVFLLTVNGVFMSMWRDNISAAYRWGMPGVGYFVRTGTGGDPTKFCWKEVRARSLDPVPRLDYSAHPNPVMRDLYARGLI